MELTCPACSARYAVPVTAIPASGRLVRCSNCGAEWQAAPPEGPSAGMPSRPSGQAAAAEEATAAASRRQEPAPIETDPAGTADPQSPAKAGLASARPAAPVARRETREQEDEAASAMAMSLYDEPPERQGTGFLAGFATVTSVVLLAVTLYVKHADIAAAVPPLDAPLARYVEIIDDGRAALAGAVVRLREGG